MQGGMRITGTGSALPDRKVMNAELAAVVETSDEWIRERTGIGQRHISTGETVVSLAVKAALAALEQAQKTAAEVDLILLATCSPEALLPCSACQVQAQLGAVNALAFDLNAACSGFLFALATANAYLQTGTYRNALVIGSEVLSKLIDWTDRTTCILFGDGAGAVFLESSGAGGLLGSALHSDGGKGQVLACRERSLQNPYYQEEAMEACHVQMNGQEVYRFATRQVPVCIGEAVEAAGLSVDDIDLFVLHQANVRIIDAVAKRLGVDRSKFPTNLERVGNMSSASIPVLLDELNRAGRLHRGDRVVLAGFGAGLTYGACVLAWC